MLNNNTPSSAPAFLADQRGDDYTDAMFLYTDSSSLSVCAYEGAERLYGAPPPPCVTNSPLELSQAGDGFLTTASECFAEIQEVRILGVPICAAQDNSESEVFVHFEPTSRKYQHLTLGRCCAGPPAVQRPSSCSKSIRSSVQCIVSNHFTSARGGVCARSGRLHVATAQIHTDSAVKTAGGDVLQLRALVMVPFLALCACVVTFEWD